MAFAALRSIAAVPLNEAELARTARACIREICPHTEKTLTLGDAKKTGDLAVLYDNSYLKPYIEEQLNVMFQGRQKLATLGNDSLATADKTAAKVRPELEKIFMAVDLFAASSEFSADRQRAGDNFYPMTRSRVQASGISDKSKSLLLSLDDKHLLESSGNILYRLDYTDVFSFLRSMTPKPKTLQEGIRNIRDSCLLVASQITKQIHLPTWYFGRVFSECLSKPEALEKSPSSLKQAYSSMLLGILLNDFLAKGPEPKFTEAEFLQRLNDIRKFTKSRLPSPAWNEQSERAYCHKKIARNWILSLSASRVTADRVKQMTKDVINAAVAEIGDGDPRAGELRKYLEGIPVVAPTELAAVTDILSELSSSATAYRIFSSPDFGRKPETDLIGVVMTEDFARHLQPDRAQMNIKEVCDEINLPLINDQFIGDWKEIDIGQIAALRLEYGYGIFAHEIGHAVAHFMKEAPAGPVSAVWDHRKCVDSFHGGTEGTESVYSEEDWADYFSARMLKRLRPEHAELQNFACLFSKNSPRHGILTPVIVNTTSDAHSNDFFRMVHVHKVLNDQMPVSCSTVMHELNQPSCL